MPTFSTTFVNTMPNATTGLDTYGITEYLNKSQRRIVGKVKCRYEDFHVHEIGLDRRIQRLTELYQPHELVKEMTELDGHVSGLNFLSNRSYLYTAESKIASLVKGRILNHDDATTLQNFLTLLHTLSVSTAPSKLSDPPHCVLAGNLSARLEKYLKSSNIDPSQNVSKDKALQIWKQLRKDIHLAIKEHFPFCCTGMIEVSKTNEDVLEATSLLHVPQQVREEAMSAMNGMSAPATATIGKQVCFLKKALQPLLLARMFLIKVYPKAECIKFLESSSKDDVIVSLENSSINAVPSKSKINKSLWKQLNNNERWPKDHPPWLHFRLYKENRDTAEAIAMVAKCLNRRTKDFCHAGIKDRRGITVQSVAIYKATINQMKRAMLHPSWDKNIYVSTFSYQPTRIRLGDLVGNHFCVAIRNVKSSDKQLVHELFDQLKEKGFINYFGLQRFGTFNVKTHEIGSALLRKQWDPAVRLLLGETVEALDNEEQYSKRLRTDNQHDDGVEPNSSETSTGVNNAAVSDGVDNTASRSLRNRRRIACELYLKQKDAKSALAVLPYQYFIERTLLEGLKLGHGSLSCLQKLPRNVLKLYLHAAQSLIFNQVASYRLSTYGMIPVLGDLVKVGFVDYTEKIDESTDNSIDMSDSSMLVDTIDSEAMLAKYTIYDVVLPIPGKNVVYPVYLKHVYEETTLQSLGHPLQKFQSPFPHVCRLSGGYRHIVVKPADVHYECIKNPSAQDNLILSDVNCLLSRNEVSDTSQPMKSAPNYVDAAALANAAGEIDSYGKINLICDSQPNTRAANCGAGRINKTSSSSSIDLTLKQGVTDSFEVDGNIESCSTASLDRDEAAGGSTTSTKWTSNDCNFGSSLADKNLGHQANDSAQRSLIASVSSEVTSSNAAVKLEEPNKPLLEGAGTSLKNSSEMSNVSHSIKSETDDFDPTCSCEMAVRFSCTLPKSAYLTMALREILE